MKAKQVFHSRTMFVSGSVTNNSNDNDFAEDNQYQM